MENKTVIVPPNSPTFEITSAVIIDGIESGKINILKIEGGAVVEAYAPVPPDEADIILSGLIRNTDPTSSYREYLQKKNEGKQVG
jgi:hypothetical protein